MATSTFKKLASLKSQLASLQAAADRELAKIPQQYGFTDKESFLTAFHAATGGRSNRRCRPSGSARASATQPRRRRSKITPEMKQQLKTMVAEGKTGAAIAQKLGISLPTVANIKKELGLSKSRKK